MQRVINDSWYSQAIISNQWYYPTCANKKKHVFYCACVATYMIGY